MASRGSDTRIRSSRTARRSRTTPRRSRASIRSVRRSRTTGTCVTDRSRCRICEADSLESVLDLGLQPLANSFIKPDEVGRPEPRYPLELARCTSCGHVQLSVTVPPEIMFRNYLYVSGTSETIPAHFAEYAKDVAERLVPKGGLVVEIGSNDGTLLRLVDVRRVGVHGGSIRVFISRDGDASPEVKKLVDLEEQISLRSGRPLGPFVQAVGHQREDLRRVLGEIRLSRHVAGYGAPAKGNTLLNYCGIDQSILDFIVDRSPLKHGLLTPGTHIPVEPLDRLLASDIRDTLLLAWNFEDEILRQQEAYSSRGGRFIIPIPDPPGVLLKAPS